MTRILLCTLCCTSLFQGCAGLNNLALTPYAKKRAAERNERQHLPERQAANAQARNEAFEQRKQERERQEAAEAAAVQDRARAREVTASQRAADIAEQKAAREAHEHSEEGLRGRACSLQEDLDQFNERIKQEKRIGKESGYVNARLMHDLAANKLACEDELAQVRAEYKALTGRPLEACSQP
jgi:hypothetical protein